MSNGGPGLIVRTIRQVYGPNMRGVSGVYRDSTVVGTLPGQKQTMTLVM